MKPIIADKSLIARCGLYCGSCKKHLAEKCPSCHQNEKASWCKIRSCCMEYGYASCADCKEFSDPMDCRKFNNFISKIFALVFKSDRAACIAQINESGYEGFAAFMVEHRIQSIRKT